MFPGDLTLVRALSSEFELSFTIHSGHHYEKAFREISMILLYTFLAVRTSCNWFVYIPAFGHDNITLEFRMKPAFMIIDLQKAYYDDETQESMKKASKFINAAIPLFRKKNLPVIWVQHIDKEDGSEPGKEGFDFIDQLKPDSDDYRVHKRYRNTFNKTNCLEIIKKEDIDTVIITGYCAEFCIQGTIIGALDQDLVPILLKNGIASGNNVNVKFIESINEIISFHALQKVLE